jgi:hypothetical protein
MLVPHGFATHAHICTPIAGFCILTGTSLGPHLGKDEQLDHFGPSTSASMTVAPPVAELASPNPKGGCASKPKKPLRPAEPPAPPAPVPAAPAPPAGQPMASGPPDLPPFPPENQGMPAEPSNRFSPPAVPARLASTLVAPPAPAPPEPAPPPLACSDPPAPLPPLAGGSPAMVECWQAEPSPSSAIAPAKRHPMQARTLMRQSRPRYCDHWPAGAIVSCRMEDADHDRRA